MNTTVLSSFRLLAFITMSLALQACASTADGPDGSGGKADDPNPLNLPVKIISPAVGTFTNADSVTVNGIATPTSSMDQLFVNGVVVPVQADGTWSTTVPVNREKIITSVLAELSSSAAGVIARDRIALIAGESVADGNFSPESIAIRINDTGLNSVEPLVGTLAASAVDIAELLPVGTVLIENKCFAETFLGCAGHGTIRVANPKPKIAGVDVDLDSGSQTISARVDVRGLDLNVSIQGTGLIPDCEIKLTADRLSLRGGYALSPGEDGTTIDVVASRNLEADFGGFDIDLDCGLGVIDNIIEWVLPDVEELARQSLEGFLGDPDGSGPKSDPVAEAAKEALSGLPLTGVAVDALKLVLDAPLFVIDEDSLGVTIGADGRVVATHAAEQAHVFSGSFHTPTEFPAFQPMTPSGLSYGLGLCISPSFFNQLLKVAVENGLLDQEVTELDGKPLTASTLGLLLHAYKGLPKDQELKFMISPSIPPFMSGDMGSHGELGELVISHLVIDIRNADDNTLQNRFAVDVSTGVDLTVDPETRGLAPSITLPDVDDVEVIILDNTIGNNERDAAVVLQLLVAGLLPDVATALGAFPIPEVLGFAPVPVEIAREGSFYSVYVDLLPAE